MLAKGGAADRWGLDGAVAGSPRPEGEAYERHMEMLRKAAFKGR
jgi:hypothetical protein